MYGEKKSGSVLPTQIKAHVDETSYGSTRSGLFVITFKYKSTVFHKTLVRTRFGSVYSHSAFSFPHIFCEFEMTNPSSPKAAYPEPLLLCFDYVP